MADGFEGMSELLASLESLPGEMKGETAKVIQGEANAMQAAVRQAYPYKSGKLVQGIKQTSRGPLSITVRSTAKTEPTKSGHRFDLGTLYDMGTHKQPPRPTFIPAKYRHLKRYQQELVTILRKVKVRGMDGSAT
jgi:HK97 gp10 family phage protein